MLEAALREETHSFQEIVTVLHDAPGRSSHATDMSADLMRG